LICFSVSVAVWIAIEYWADFRPTSQVDPYHYEIRYDQYGHPYRHEHYIRTNYRDAAYVGALALAVGSAFWLPYFGQGFYWGPIFVILGSFFGYLTYRYPVLEWDYSIRKPLRKIKNIISWIFEFLSLLVLPHALIHPKSFQDFEALLPPLLFVLIWVTVLINSLIDFPAEMTARRRVHHLWDRMSDGDVNLLLRLEDDKKRSRLNYRDYLKVQIDLMRQAQEEEEERRRRNPFGL
jgi:hypothetical protein